MILAINVDHSYGILIKAGRLGRGKCRTWLYLALLGYRRPLAVSGQRRRSRSLSSTELRSILNLSHLLPGQRSVRHFSGNPSIWRVRAFRSPR